MKTKTHSSYQQLQNAATELRQQILETPISFYFRIFDEVGNCSMLHIYYKK